MSHSVSRHLRVDVEGYDDAIRRFIPGYEAMIARAAGEVARVGPRTVLDLGAGTGSLSAAALAREEVDTVVLLDVDPEMLDRARHRLAAAGPRARFAEGSFEDPLPPADAVMASLSLHHIPDLADKRALYARVFRALSPGGVFVNADATVPAADPARAATYRSWIEHMGRHGIGEEEARGHLDDWSEEDTYFPLEAELEALRSAGFHARCAWMDEPSTVLVASKPA